MRPNGSNVYVANAGSDNVSQYTVGVGGMLFAHEPGHGGRRPGPVRGGDESHSRTLRPEAEANRARTA